MVDNINTVGKIKMAEYDFELAYTKYLDYLTDRGMKPQTIRRYTYTFKLLLKWLNGRPLTRATYVDWITEMEKTASLRSVQSKHAQIHAFFDYLVDCDLFEVNMLAGLRTQPIKRDTTPGYTYMFSTLPKQYLDVAKARYCEQPEHNNLLDWVCIECLYSLGIPFSAIASVHVSFPNGDYIKHDNYSGVPLKFQGPCDAMKAYADFKGNPTVFTGEWFQSSEKYEMMLGAINRVKRYAGLKDLLTPTDFVVNFCARLLAQSASVEDLSNYTTHSMEWCARLAQEYRVKVKDRTVMWV